MAGWQPTHTIDYKPGAEDLGGFAEKYQAVVEGQIFDILNLLRSGNAEAGLDDKDAVAYGTRINTADGGIYIRDALNENWILLGYVEQFFGLKATDIGAIINGGGLTKLTCGTDAEKPTKDVKTNEFYIAYDTSKVYRFTGAVWKEFLSLNFEDILNYEKYCIARKELSSIFNDKGKIPVLDTETGKGNFDITGSPEKIWDILIEIQDLHDGDALVFNKEKDRWVNLPNSAFDRTTVSGLIEKIFNDEYIDKIITLDVNEAAVSVAAKKIIETVDLDAIKKSLEDRIKELEGTIKDMEDTIADKEEQERLAQETLYVGEDKPDKAAVWIKTPAGYTPGTYNLRNIVIGSTAPTDTDKIWLAT